jgi:hypothetical protein
LSVSKPIPALLAHFRLIFFVEKREKEIYIQQKKGIVVYTEVDNESDSVGGCSGLRGLRWMRGYGVAD